MIKTFKDREAKKIFARQRSAKIPPDLQQVALRKMNNKFEPLHAG